MNKNFVASRQVPPKSICERKVIGFTEGLIFLDVAHTYSYRSFVVFKQRTTFLFFFFASWLICRNSLFLRKNRNIVLFVNSLPKRKAQELINKVLAELLITTPSATDGSSLFNQAEICELHLPGDAQSGSHLWTCCSGEAVPSLDDTVVTFPPCSVINVSVSTVQNFVVRTL